jgi:hypothetical protein
VARAGLLLDGLHEAGLADARLALDRQRRGSSLGERTEGGSGCGQWGRTPHETVGRGHGPSLPEDARRCPGFARARAPGRSGTP